MGKKKRLRKLLFIKKAQLKAAQVQKVADTPPPAPQVVVKEKSKAKAKKRTSKKRSSKK